jgi:hypothetical protein
MRRKGDRGAQTRWQEILDEIASYAPGPECRWCREADEAAEAERRDEAALVAETEAYLREQAGEVS